MLTKLMLSFFVLGLLTVACSSQRVEAKGQIIVFESEAKGFNTKNFFYDNGEEVVVFDTQFTPELARKSIEFIRSKTANPITHVIITHPNPDKFNGISEFRKIGARIISSQRTEKGIPGIHNYKKYYFVEIAKMFTDDTYPKLAPIDSTFKHHEELKLRNGESISLKEFNLPGVSTNQTVAFIPKLNALLVGDLIHHKAHAWLEGGVVNGKATPTIDSWITILNRLPQEFGKRVMVYGGRGENVFLHRAVKAQVAYLQAARNLVRSYVKGKKTLGSEDFVKLQSLMETAFPDYELGYMIQYGVYGLAQSEI